MKDTHASIAGLMARGFLIVLPVLLLALLFATFYDVLAGWIRPVLNALPGVVFQTSATRFVAVALVFLALLLLVGAAAGTRLGQASGRRIELAFLSRFPFYNTFRTLAMGLGGDASADTMQPVLVTVDDPGLVQFGFLLETHPDGHFTVFLPGSPNPGSGTTVIVGSERLETLKMSSTGVLRCLSNFGRGTAALLERSRAEAGKRGQQ